MLASNDYSDLYGAEMRRCLIALDIPGVMKLWKHVAPHLAEQSPADALCSLHLARLEAKSMPQKLKDYSLAWLTERGFQKIDGQWIKGPVPVVGTASAVGIASKSSDPRFSKRIVTAMEDALLNGLAKGVTEPPMQRELMLKARDKVRFKARKI